MAKRMILMLVALIALLASLGFVKYRQVEAAIAQGASFQPPPTAVTTVVAKVETWPSTLSVIGTAAAAYDVALARKNLAVEDCMPRKTSPDRWNRINKGAQSWIC